MVESQALESVFGLFAGYQEMRKAEKEVGEVERTISAKRHWEGKKKRDGVGDDDAREP